MKQAIGYYWTDYRFRLMTWRHILVLMLKVGPVKMLRLLFQYPWMVTLLKANRLHKKLCTGRPPAYHKATAMVINGAVAGYTNMLGPVLRYPDRVIINQDMVPPEIFHAMGLAPFMAELNGIMLPMIDPHVMEDYIDASENQGIPPDICSLPKSTMGLFMKGEVPPAKAIVTSNLPCDGGMSSYTVMENLLQLPTFRLDIPFDVNTPKALVYFREELKRMIQWLEAHTPGRMDWDRLREICEERNRMVEAELELWEMLRVRPAPLAAEAMYLTHLWYFNLFPGHPDATRTIRRIVDLGRKNLEAEPPVVRPEKYRALLWNPPLLHFIDLFNWAEKAYGVSLIMDSMSFNRLPYIDTTTTRDTMLEGIGRNIMNGPMARHTRGPADNYLDDIFYIHKHFGIDMLWVAGHIGCKNTQAMNGILREKCREAGLRLLIINYDLSDPRVVSREAIIEQVNHFMENIMQAKRQDI
ncbi:hypothetical protein HNR65_000518 [Desulfosalsimonas propionicica]|uniref:2-hydroxyacyl-CoA dehydratase n=1 Tax=Desulfosalsimonas propionicica TaxID=332175 RepID=A0A7W0C6S9_9BACT|nr:2-hydroxyacyl-CoA dehydratase family protein [Desulfosalsimonas propionicica]MBA2880211.1 hypothetical protein [Desulfosalsimonas propionicica]